MNEPMTFEKVAEFIDGLSISEMDKHELKSRVSDLEQDVSLRAYSKGYDKGDSDGRYFERAKVIDEFLEKVLHDNCEGKCPSTELYCYKCVARRVAEQMKGGQK